MVITELLQRICSSGIYKGCEHEHHYAVGHNREVHIFIPGQEPRDTSAAIVRFTVEFKHMITYNFTCDHLKGRETFREECKQLRIDRARNLVNPWPCLCSATQNLEHCGRLHCLSPTAHARPHTRPPPPPPPPPPRHPNPSFAMPPLCR